MNSGIYKILNLNNGKFYIGSTNNFSRRFSDHKSKLNNGIHPNIHLQSAWTNDGNTNFDIIILEECGVEILTEREQYYIDTLSPEYNFCPLARSSRGRPISDETRKKLSMARAGKRPGLGRTQNSDEIKLRVDKLKGRTKSEEEKKITGDKNSEYARTAEHNIKLSQNSTNKRAVAMMDSETMIVIKEFDSILAAMRYIGETSHHHICSCCSGRKKIAHGFKWKYIGEKKRVVVLNNIGDNIGEYNSFAHAARVLNKSRCYIKKCFDLNKVDYDGYKYECLL